MLKEQLVQIIDQLAFLKMEMLLIGGALMFLILGLINKNNLVHRIAFCTVLVVAFVAKDHFLYPQEILTNTLAIGPLESLVKLLLVGFCIWIVFYSNAKDQSPEFYFLVLSILIGSVFMTSANHLLVAYISIELTSFSSYLITNFNFKKRSFEAGLKYLLFGGVSSAVMLYGISIIYGLGGSLNLNELNLSGEDPFLAIGILALVGGLLFKISVFPFHIWTPSTYQEAPTDAVAVLSVVPKIAALVLLHRIVFIVDLDSIYWLMPLLAVVGMATILLGTFGALKQRNVKRLMAYGAIAHSGLFLSCLLITGEMGSTAFFWYAFIYATMNLALFYLVSVFEEEGITSIAEFSGLGKKHPYMGVLFLLVLISLIGLPPTAGFTAKFYLFSGLWYTFERLGDGFILSYFMVAVLSVILSLFYYLRIPYYFFLGSVDKTFQFDIKSFPKLFATILVMLLFWFFLSPEILNNIVLNFKAVEW